jgi:RNA polymerase sigma factor (sigma-70 family)
VIFRPLVRWTLVASSLPTLESPSDGELISAVRGGDADAYGELFARHVHAARRLARQLVPAGDADDLVSEAFAKVLVVLQRGGGPDLAFRAYLLTAVRRLHVDRIRSTARLHTTGDLTPFDPGIPFRDTAVEGFENAAAARAFASLPERWQLVLWHTEVEGQKPAEVAPLLGMSPNSVSALAYRAREGLRQAYLSMHAQDVDEDACAWTRANLGAHVRGGLSRRDAARVETHLAQCRRCAAIHLELGEVNARLGALLAPLLLGTAAAAYVGGTAAGGGAGAAAVTGGVAALVGRVRDAIVTHAPTAAVAGAAASVVAAGLVLAVLQHDPGTSTETTAPPRIGTTSAPPAHRREAGHLHERPAADRRPSGAPEPSSDRTAAAVPVSLAGPGGAGPTRRRRGGGVRERHGAPAAPSGVDRGAGPDRPLMTTAPHRG